MEASSQTAAPRFTPDERAQLRHAFLRKFGLDQLAAASRGGREAGEPPPRKRVAVPDYVWALYEAHSTATPATVEAQIIRHYGPSLVQAEGGGGSARLSFNLSATGREPAKEHVVRAQLRLPDWKMPKGGNANISVVVLDGQTEDGEGRPGATKEWADFEQRPWIDLDGEVFEATRQNGTNGDGTLDELHLTLHFPADIGGEEADKMLKSAALIVYSNERDGEEVETIEKEGSAKGTNWRQRRRAKRRAEGTSGSAERGGGSRWNQQKGSSSGSSSSSSRTAVAAASSSSSTGRAAGGGGGHQRHHRPHHGTGQCRRAELYVDFAELNWQDWIMAPTGYEAYQCKGRCTHPMPSQLNTTNHAIVQSLIHSIDPAAAAAPSCVPVQMSAISILYRDVNDVIVVKTYADMRVDACGCH